MKTHSHNTLAAWRLLVCVLMALPAFLAFGATASASAPASERQVALPDYVDRDSLDELPADIRRAILTGEATVAPLTYYPGDGGAAPMSIVQGNCGYSFFWIRNLNPGRINLSWGFGNLCFLATSYQWSYSVVGPSYSRSDSGGGTLWFRREQQNTYNGPRGGLGWYNGCANVWAQGSGLGFASGTACDTFRLTQ